MRIRAFTTGSISVKHAFLDARTGPRRRLDLLLPGPWVGPLPVHVWLIEHGDERILVDTGERSDPHDPPFARSSVTSEDELPGALRRAGVELGEITLAALTHMHPDHYNGAAHLRVPVLVAESAWREINGLGGRVLQRLSHAPLPDADFRRVALDAGPFGAFAAHRRLTADGRVVLVATPGHTRGHCSVIAIDDDARHILIAGDATDSVEQLHARRADAIAPDPELQRQTIDRIAAYAREHPTVYLPSHDPTSADRLAEGTVLASFSPGS